jgi:hypothetical protein
MRCNHVVRLVFSVFIAALGACQSASPVPPVRGEDCTPGPLTDSARNGEFVFETSGVVDLQNEFLIVTRRGARSGDRLEASLRRLDASGQIGLPSTFAVVRDANNVVFRLPVYKPAGEGCWRVDVSDERGTASYVIAIHEP